jgi:hypothetical protein
MCMVKECQKISVYDGREKANKKTTSRWREEVEEYLNIMGGGGGRQWAETVGNRERLCLEPRSAADCSA